MNVKGLFSLKHHKDETSRYIAFFVRILLVYIIWFSFRELMEKSSWLRPLWDDLHFFFSKYYILMARPFLEMLIEAPLYVNTSNIFLPGGAQPLYVAPHCVGIAPMAIMSLVFWWNILPLKRRLRFWIYAMCTIVFLNWFRITTLGYMLHAGWKQFFYFSHSYTYILMIYGALFWVMLAFYKPYFDHPSLENPEQ